MKILGQMSQPWGQNMLKNRYKSPPIATAFYLYFGFYSDLG